MQAACKIIAAVNLPRSASLSTNVPNSLRSNFAVNLITDLSRAWDVTCAARAGFNQFLRAVKSLKRVESTDIRWARTATGTSPRSNIKFEIFVDCPWRRTIASKHAGVISEPALSNNLAQTGRAA